jgi:hypothetical protein
VTARGCAAASSSLSSPQNSSSSIATVGTPITLIRELTAADRQALAFLFGHLSADSRHQRFLTPKRELSAAKLARMTAVDHWHSEL